MDRSLLKRAATALLDAVAAPHPLGHQDSKAARYVLGEHGAAPVELMFQKDATSPPKIWVTASAAGPLVGGSIKQSRSQASKLWTKTGKDGSPNYGRHSALEQMPQLGSADLVCLTPNSLAELGQIMDQLLSSASV